MRIEIYQDRAGEWRWTFYASNGRKIADSGEGYASEYNAVRAARRLKELGPSAPIKRRDGTVLNESARSGLGPDPF